MYSLQDHYQKTILFVAEKHKSQLVPGTNANYLLHLSNVAMEVILAHKENPEFDINYAVQLALLHDVLEDTDTTTEELIEHFGPEVAKGVWALTKNANLPSKTDQIKDSCIRINQLRKEVAIVKLADRITNLQIPPGHWTSQKIETYCKDAELIAKQLIGKNEYLDQRIEQKIGEYKEYI